MNQREANVTIKKQFNKDLLNNSKLQNQKQTKIKRETNINLNEQFNSFIDIIARVIEL